MIGCRLIDRAHSEKASIDPSLGESANTRDKSRNPAARELRDFHARTTRKLRCHQYVATDRNALARDRRFDGVQLFAEREIGQSRHG